MKISTGERHSLCLSLSLASLPKPLRLGDGTFRQRNRWSGRLESGMYLRKWRFCNFLSAGVRASHLSDEWRATCRLSGRNTRPHLNNCARKEAKQIYELPRDACAKLFAFSLPLSLDANRIAPKLRSADNTSKRHTGRAHFK